MKTPRQSDVLHGMQRKWASAKTFQTAATCFEPFQRYLNASDHARCLVEAGTAETRSFQEASGSNSGFLGPHIRNVQGPRDRSGYSTQNASPVSTLFDALDTADIQRPLADHRLGLFIAKMLSRWSWQVLVLVFAALTAAAPQRQRGGTRGGTRGGASGGTQLTSQQRAAQTPQRVSTATDGSRIVDMTANVK